jgi:FKBP-type peptidyl-prolyl cis-trans isomerase
MRKVREGDTILVHISGSLDDGTEFATSGGEVPMELSINDGMRISALQQSALGMAVGEKKQFDWSLTRHLEKCYYQVSLKLLIRIH